MIVKIRCTWNYLFRYKVIHSRNSYRNIYILRRWGKSELFTGESVVLALNLLRMDIWQFELNFKLTFTYEILSKQFAWPPIMWLLKRLPFCIHQAIQRYSSNGCVTAAHRLLVNSDQSVFNRTGIETLQCDQRLFHLHLWYESPPATFWQHLKRYSILEPSRFWFLCIEIMLFSTFIHESKLRMN